MNNEVLEQLKQEYNETLKRAQDLGEIIANCVDIDTNHCGLDADMDDACCQARGHQPEGYTYKDLLGMEVIGIGGKSMKCEGCPTDCGNCVKVELVGGDYICLAKPQEDERPVINFDEEESNVMVDIKDKTEAFMDYLESVVKSRTHGLG